MPSPRIVCRWTFARESSSGGCVFLKYVVAARMAAAGVLGITLPDASIDMKEDSRFRVVACLEASGMRPRQDCCLGLGLAGVRPDEDRREIDCAARLMLAESARFLRSLSSAWSCASSCCCSYRRR